MIRYYYSVEFNEDDLNYDRLLTHLKFFAKRIFTENQHRQSDGMLLEIAEKNYPEAFDCALKVKYYIENNYNYVVVDDEVVYLTIHIHRVISVLRDELK
ncbi:MULTISPECIES: PRD domain-containing protein [unclassified Clostridium]|uniref:PRD domain-containing protein n=1 Tax=unclassified Clostridium TaxID=2614128 RepID=UPI002892AB80|nr:PRD domain-containing protein [Clostridium sp. K12(2020)]